MHVNRQGANAFIITDNCPSCGEKLRLRKREFSPSAWLFLIENNELDKCKVGEPICDTCYEDFRELLIESMQDLERINVPESFRRELELGGQGLQDKAI